MSMIFPLQFRAQTALAKRSAGGLLIPNRPRVVALRAPSWGLPGVPDQADQVNVLLTPLNLFDFAEDEGNPMAQMFAGVLPTGLTIDIDTGIITGTPTVIAAPASVTATMDNGVGTDGDVFFWEITA